MLEDFETLAPGRNLPYKVRSLLVASWTAAKERQAGDSHVFACAYIACGWGSPQKGVHSFMLYVCLCIVPIKSIKGIKLSVDTEVCMYFTHCQCSGVT